MFARVFTIRAPADQLDILVRGLRDFAEEARALEGFRHGYALIDRQAGEVMTVTLWESETAMMAVQPRVRSLLTEAVQAGRAELIGSSQYEVALEI